MKPLTKKTGPSFTGTKKINNLKRKHAKKAPTRNVSQAKQVSGLKAHLQALIGIILSNDKSGAKLNSTQKDVIESAKKLVNY